MTIQITANTAIRFIQREQVNSIMKRGVQKIRHTYVYKKRYKMTVQKKRLCVRIVERGMMPEIVCGIMNRSVHKKQQQALQLYQKWSWKLHQPNALKN